jgi:hypothetical protein
LFHKFCQNLEKFNGVQDEERKAIIKEIINQKPFGESGAFPKVNQDASEDEDENELQVDG